MPAFMFFSAMIDVNYVLQKYIYVKHPFLLPVMMIDDKP